MGEDRERRSRPREGILPTAIPYAAIIAAGEEIGDMKGRFRKVYAKEIHVLVENGNVKQQTVKHFQPGRDGVKGPGGPLGMEVAVPNAGEPIPTRALRDR